MAVWEKLYQLINWQNKPSRTTPLGRSKLSILDEAVDGIDDRVIELHTTVETQSTDLDNKVDKYKTITTSTDLNTILESGFYSIPDGCTNIPAMQGGGKATLIVVVHPYGASSGQVLQILVNQLNVNSTDKMYYRIGTIGTQTTSFLAWNRVLNLDDIPMIASAIKQWYTGSYTINLYGIGLPGTYYPASSTYSGNRYLDVATGIMYDCQQTGPSTYTWRQAPVVLQLKSDINASAIEDLQEDISQSLTFMSRERRNITSDLGRLSTAVAEQNLAKYGYKIGDYFTGASGYTYILADYNTFKGTITPYCITSNHLGIVVDTHKTSQWHSDDASDVGYNGSVLNTFLKGTVLDNIKADFKALFGGSTGLEHLIAHSKLFTTALANWAWQTNQYISALSEVQTIGSVVWGANSFQTGEASKKLELFDKYKWTEIFGDKHPWLRDLYTASNACRLDVGGAAYYYAVTNSYFVVGLINFH